MYFTRNFEEISETEFSKLRNGNSKNCFYDKRNDIAVYLDNPNDFLGTIETYYKFLNKNSKIWENTLVFDMGYTPILYSPAIWDMEVITRNTQPIVELFTKAGVNIHYVPCFSVLKKSCKDIAHLKDQVVLVSELKEKTGFESGLDFVKHVITERRRQ